MDSAKRAWVYEGLSLAEDVGVVAAVDGEAPRLLAPQEGVILFGDDLASGLRTPLEQLIAKRVPFGFAYRPDESLRNWWQNGWVAELVRSTNRPTVFLGAFAWNGVAPTGAMYATERLVEQHGGSVVWLAPPDADTRILKEIAYSQFARPHYVFESNDLDIQLGPDRAHPTAVGYAGWAGALWNWLT